MSYGTFSSYEEVAERFQIKLIEEQFVQEQDIIVSMDLLKFIEDNLKTRRSYVSENAICESVIYPILSIVAKQHDLAVWSHVRFDVSEAEGLMGVPDFLIAPVADIGTTFSQPIMCIAEAKQENFNKGWAQALAEMIAAQKVNVRTELEIFAIVTTGAIWQFGCLRNKQLTLDPTSYSALDNLLKLFRQVNWLLEQAKKNLEILS